MSRYAPVLWLALWPQIVVALPGVEQPVEGFARLVWASNEGEYGSNRGTQVASSWEYAQDGTQAVVWESAPVPQGYTRGFVTFAWSCGLARQEEAHGLYLNDVKILSFISGLMVKPTSWEEGDFALRFEPVMKDAAGDVHGVMYLRVPAATVHSGKPAGLSQSSAAGPLRGDSGCDKSHRLWRHPGPGPGTSGLQHTRCQGEGDCGGQFRHYLATCG